MYLNTLMFKYSAVIVEPREHKALEFVLRNFLENLSDDWGFIIFHGKKNKNFIVDLFDNSLKEFKHRISKLIELDVENLTIKQYNEMSKNANFYKCIDTEIFLRFETDAMILNSDIINNFLEYDYVGAPWMNGSVGNGGLSLRRKSKMIEICEKVNPIFTKHDDLYFSLQNVVKLNKPSFMEAQKFSVETVFHEKSFGIHACWKYLNEYEMGFLVNKYPDIKTLIELNK